MIDTPNFRHLCVLPPSKIRQAGQVVKGWGHEDVWVSNSYYCSKTLNFYKVGNKFSLHYHKNKLETWRVVAGRFMLNTIDLVDGSPHSHELKVNDVWTNPPLLPHQLIALEDNSVMLEISTADDPDDNYRLAPGDSQKDGHEKTI